MNDGRWSRHLCWCLALLLFAPVSGIAADPVKYRFTFSGDAAVQTGWTSVHVTNLYSSEAGYGFENLNSLNAGTGFISSENPFLFSVRLPEGIYRVTVTLGGDMMASLNTVKAEARRLMLEHVRVGRKEGEARSFRVHVRQPGIPGGERVRLKQRERDTEMVTWDDRLTLEFNGKHPAVRALEIVAAPETPTVFLTGDSTVCDQPSEPWNSWGQMLPRFFGPEVAVANYAQSGESIRSSLGSKRFEKVFSQIKSNDWLFVQFGHNDMKDKATNALAVYRSNLTELVQRTRAAGAVPVLVTSMERKAGLKKDTLTDYPRTVREVAAAEGVALIDLHATSKVLYRALGDRLDEAFQDGTHHNNYGSYELARCVVEGIRQQVPDLAGYLDPRVPAFDPGQPDDPAKFYMPASPAISTEKPEGN